MSSTVADNKQPAGVKQPEGVNEQAVQALSEQWRIDDLDLATYLDRLGCSDLTRAPSKAPDAAATAALLRRLHRAHVAALAFGNLDVTLGRPPSLDLTAIHDKLVHRRRGGYCFEQNLLFAAALERLGFVVSRLGARAQMGTVDLRPRTHMTLAVETTDGSHWLADVGFGGEGLLEPVPLVAGIVVDQDGWGYRLDRLDPSGNGPYPAEPPWMLSALHHDGPFALYSFTPEPWLLIDYVVANHYVATHPSSPFVRQLVLQRTGAIRHTLIGSALVATSPDGHADYTEVAPADLPEVLLKVFGVDVADDANLLVTTASC